VVDVAGLWSRDDVQSGRWACVRLLCLERIVA
jgi:hypothetical protein